MGPVGVGLSVTLSLFLIVVVLEFYFAWRAKQRSRMIRESMASSFHGLGTATTDVPSEMTSTSVVCFTMAKSGADWAAQRTRETKEWIKTGLLRKHAADNDKCHSVNEKQWGASCLPIAKRTTDYAIQTARLAKDQITMMMPSRFSCMSKEGFPDAAERDCRDTEHGLAALTEGAETCSTACLAMAKGSAKWATQITRETIYSLEVLSTKLSCVSTGATLPVCQDECITVHGMAATADGGEGRWLAMAKRNGNWVVQRTREMKDWMKMLMLRKRGVGSETDETMERSGQGSSEMEETADEAQKQEAVDGDGGEDNEEDDIFKMVGLWGHPRYLFTITEETKEEMEQEEDARSRGRGSRKGSRASSELLFLPSPSPSPYATPSSTPPFTTPSASPGPAYHYPFAKLNQQQFPAMSAVNVDIDATEIPSVCCVPTISLQQEAMAVNVDIDMAGTQQAVCLPPIASSSSSLLLLPHIEVPSSSPNTSSCPLTEDSSSSLSSSFSSATPGTVSPKANPQQTAPSPKRQQQRNPLTLLFEHPASSSSSSSSVLCNNSHSRVYPISLPSSFSIDGNGNRGTDSLKLAEAAVGQASFKIPAFSQPTTPSPFLRHVLRQKQHNRPHCIRGVYP